MARSHAKPTGHAKPSGHIMPSGHTLPFMIAVLLSAALWAWQPFFHADHSWSDRRLIQQATPLDAPVAVVEITPQDIGAFGGPPIGRDVLARVLDRLRIEGAKRILVDLVFTAPMVEQSDNMLKAALTRLGPERVALASGAYANSRPDAMFASGLPVLDARLFADRDQWFRSIGATDRSLGPNPARWLASGELSPASVDLNLSLSAGNITRLSVGELLGALRGAHNLDDHLVVLTQSTQIGAPRAYLPGLGETNRGVLLALGAAAVLEDHDTQVGYSRQAAIIISALALVGGFFITTTMRTARLTALAVLIFAGALLAGSTWSVGAFSSAAMPFTSLVIMATGMLLAFLHRLRIASLVGVFMKGDMSPEEAWDWRTHSERADPVFLFAANGTIKRMNESAQALMAAHGEPLRAALLPSFGAQHERAVVGDQHFALEWPNPAQSLVIARDVTQAAQREQALQTELVTDGLTGLLNRAGFEKALQAASDNARGYALFYMDMNGFKAVNDTYGHDAGDELLRFAAHAFTGTVRDQDAVARLGGDEFAVLATGDWTHEKAQALADLLEASLAEPVVLEEATVQVGVAVGIALPQSADEPSADVVKRADQAMYARKAVIKGTAPRAGQAA